MKYLNVPSSGSYANLTHSRNRFGQYVRTRATPVNPNTAFQSAVRARLAANAGAYRALTDAQRAGWADLGLQMERTDSLGSTYNLTGLQAYSSLNGNRLAAGDAVIADAPSLVVVDVMTTVVLTLSAVAFSVAYTVTPLAAGERIFFFASPQVSAGKGFMADYRLIGVTAAAAASPFNVLAAYTARFGVPVVGNKIFTRTVRYAAGFVSLPLAVNQVVV